MNPSTGSSIGGVETAFVTEPLRQYTSLAIVRAYEAVSIILFLGGLNHVRRSGKPLYVGIYAATSLGGGVFEWIFDSKYYFRLTVDDRFTPAWTMAGEKAPLAMILFYAFFFGIPLMLILDHHEDLVRTFGPRGIYIFIASCGVFGTPLFECTNTSVTNIYKYHQKDEYLLWGMPWSNMWFGALMMVLPYWGINKSRVLVALLPRTSESPTSQYILSFLLGFAAVITGWFFASSINGLWYIIAGDVWLPTPRLF